MLPYEDGDIITPLEGRRRINARTDGTLVEVNVCGNLVYKEPTAYQFVSIKREFDTSVRGRIYLFIDEHIPVLFGQKPMMPIRRPTPEEYPKNVAKLSSRYPRISSMTRNPDHLHWLLMSKLQYDRLRALFAALIPEAAVVMIRREDGTLYPSIVQERIEGTPLQQIISYPYGQLLPDWLGHGTAVAEQIEPFLSSDDVDMNFRNFIFIRPIRLCSISIANRPCSERNAVMIRTRLPPLVS